jgi:flagellar hook-associated protein 1 FlgK
MGGLSGAMNAALSGLRVTQSQMDVVASNVSNADSIGYTRRRAQVVQLVSGDRTSGVSMPGIQRQFDGLIQRQVRVESAGAAYTDVRARYARQIDQMFGTPGSATSLDGAVNAFAKSLQALTASPADITARGQVLNQAQSLASMLNGISADIQIMREEAEARIAQGVERVNAALNKIADIDSRIQSNGAALQNSPALLDERDMAINELSRLVDIRVVQQDSGKIQIYTNGGMPLYTGIASQLSFDQRSVIPATALFTQNPAERGVGTIRLNGPGGLGIDVTAGGFFRSGEIAAELEMRDKVLVEAQAQVDDLAAALASALGDRSPVSPYTTGANSGFEINLDDPAAPGTLAAKAGNTLTVEVMTPTGPRRIQLIATDGAAPNPIPPEFGEGGATIVRYDRSGGIAGVQGAIAAALGPGFNVTLAGANLRIVDAGGGNAVTNVRASFSTTALINQGPELQLFVDPNETPATFTGSLENVNPQKRGFAGRISVNPAVLADSSLLVTYSGPPGPVTPAADNARPALLLDRLTNAQRGFSAASGISDVASGTRASVSEFARRIVENQGQKASQAISMDEGQKLVLRAVEARYSETAGVSIDEEMADLVQIQNAYAANARVVSAVSELFDVLLRIGA